MVLVNITHFRPETEAEYIMEPLLALKPIQHIKKEMAWANMTDASEAISKPVGLGSQISCGLQKFSAEKFEKALESWTKLVEEYPNASGRLILFGWNAPPQLRIFPVDNSAWSHRDCGVWK